MTLTVRLPDKLEQDLAEYCTTNRLSKSEAVKRALQDMLQPRPPGHVDLDHPFIGADARPGDVARNSKRLLREFARKKMSRG